MSEGKEKEVRKELSYPKSKIIVEQTSTPTQESREEISPEMSQMKKAMTPNIVTRFINSKHWLILLVILILEIICIYLTISQEYMKTNKEGGNNYMARNNIRAQLFYGMLQAHIEIEESNQAISTPLQSQEVDDWSLSLIFKSRRSENIFTVENMGLVRSIEVDFNKSENLDKFCLLTTEGKCKNIVSPLPLFGDANEQNIIDEIVGNLVKEANYKSFLLEGTTVESPQSQMTRSFYTMAAPINYDGRRYRDKTQDFIEQEDIYSEEFAVDVYYWGTDSIGEDVEVYVGGLALIKIALNHILQSDLNYAILSIILVWIYCTIHLKSLFISTGGMLQILFVFPFSLFIYREIYQIKQYSALQMLIIFLLLGISADNFFVFHDAWTQAFTYHQMKEDIEKRMAYTYRRAVKAILITSGTTAVAFLSTCFSPLMPIASFGIWAATVIGIDYILTITMLPAFFSLHAKYIQNKICTLQQFKTYICCCIFRKQQNIQPNLESGNSDRNVDGLIVPEPNPEINDILENENEEVIEGKYGWIEWFFGEIWSKWVNKGKYFILSLFLVWIGFNIYLTTQLEELSEQEKWVDDSHYIQKCLDYTDKFYKGPQDANVPIYITWGLTGLDQEGTDYWDPDDIGHPIWDSHFDLNLHNLEEKQLRFIEICDLLEVHSLVVQGANTVTCFMKEFRTYILGKGDVFPVPDGEFVYKFVEFTRWDINGILLRKNYNIGIIEDEGERIQMVKIVGAANCKIYAPASYFRPLYEEWEDLIELINQGSPEGMNQAVQITERWGWLDTFSEFINSAIQGMIIAITFAFFVLLISTLNIFIAIYATISIGGIIICLMGTIKLLNWEFGVIESVSCVILIGLSVDYVVHLASHYTHSTSNDNYNRMKYSLKYIAISILGGAITTLLAAFALYFCTIRFFTKFALLLTLNIIYAILFSLLFFSALSFALGPQNNSGNLKFYFAKLRRKCC